MGSAYDGYRAGWTTIAEAFEFAVWLARNDGVPGKRRPKVKYDPRIREFYVIVQEGAA